MMKAEHLKPQDEETEHCSSAAPAGPGSAGARGMLPLAASFLLLPLAVLLSMGLGKYPVSPKEIFAFFAQRWFGASYFTTEHMSVLKNVLLEIRMPRIIAAALIGSALSVSGASYQAMFVNPLVSPSILGVLSGASFGAALGIVYLKSWYAVQTATFLGGLISALIAIGVARIYRANTTIMLVLGGIISGALFTSLLELVKYLADPYNQLPTIVYWLMGSLSQVDRETALKTGVPICIGIGILLLSSRQLNALSMGDEEAKSLGVNVRRARLIIILCATVISSLTVVIAGIIGWIGLIIPHFTRLIVGPNNQRLLPAAAIFGAAYLIIVDDVCRLAFSFELPIGIVTALVGIPCFAFVLSNARKRWS